MSKKVIASKNVENAKESVKEINLSKFAKELESMNVSHAKRDRETLYIYPEDFQKSDINNEKGKRFRSSLRSKIERFCNNAFIFGKLNEMENLQKEIIAFDEFYAKNYRINDYSLKSISSSNDPSKSKNLDLFLKIVKESKGM